MPGNPSYRSCADGDNCRRCSSTVVNPIQLALSPSRRANRASRSPTAIALTIKSSVETCFGELSLDEDKSRCFGNRFDSDVSEASDARIIHNWRSKSSSLSVATLRSARTSGHSEKTFVMQSPLLAQISREEGREWKSGKSPATKSRHSAVTNRSKKG